MDLKTFLLARIAEDEETARASTGGPWRVKTSPGDYPTIWGADNIGGFGNNNATTDNLPDALHIARHGPSRVLAECAAKRAIMDIHWDRDGDCARCSDYAWFAVLDGGEYEEFPCPTVRALAAVYADHPDYQPEWAQEASQA